MLGKVYGVVARRRGRIVAEEMKEGTSFFTVTAISLWADQLRTSEIAVLAMHPALYYALFIFTVVVSPLAFSAFPDVQD